jgi:hypothetical protein
MDILLERMRFYRRSWRNILAYSKPKMMRKKMSSLNSLFTQCYRLDKLFMF